MSKTKHIFWSFLGALLFVSILFGIIRYNKRETLLKNSNSTFGILVRQYSKGKNPNAVFTYKVKDKIYEFNQIGNYTNFKKGDTVLIEYAIEDPSVARVVDKYYMQKYKHLKEK
jgi:hypothetical protein